MQRLISVLVLLPLLLAAICSSYVSAQTGGTREPVNIRGEENLDLNCPSVSFEMPVGSMRCEACKVIGEMMAYYVGEEFEDPLDTIEAVCERAQENVFLRQKKNGMRYWQFSLKPKEELSDEFKVKYLSKAERETLPCAHHFLKKHCFRLLEHHEEKFEKCTSNFLSDRRTSKSISQKIKALDDLKWCFEMDICERALKDCDARLLAQAQSQERIQFMKHEAVFGNDKFKYVADESNPTMLVRNPYAVGGDKEDENELLKNPHL